MAKSVQDEIKKQMEKEKTFLPVKHVKKKTAFFSFNM